MSVDIHKDYAPITRIHLGCNVVEDDYIELVPCTKPHRPDRVVVTARKNHMQVGSLIINVLDLVEFADALKELAEQLNDRPA
jgi:hypothetical protein